MDREMDITMDEKERIGLMFDTNKIILCIPSDIMIKYGVDYFKDYFNHKVNNNNSLKDYEIINDSTETKIIFNV